MESTEDQNSFIKVNPLERLPKPVTERTIAKSVVVDSFNLTENRSTEPFSKGLSSRRKHRCLDFSQAFLSLKASQE